MSGRSWPSSQSPFGAGRAPLALQRARLRFSRHGAGALLSHLKQIESIRRALERAGWPLAKSESRKPKPRLSFGPAVSVGYESDAEYCDVELASRIDFAKAAESLAPHLPEGYALVGAKSIPRFFPSLEQTLNIADYRLRSPLFAGTRDKWEAFHRAASFPVVKKKQDREEVVDARACVREWTLTDDVLKLRVRFGPGRTLKPERIAQAVCGLDDRAVGMGGPDDQVRVTREQMYFEKQNGDLVEP